MAIEFGCPSCQQLVRVGDGAAGKKGKCPHCQTIIQIPGGASQPAAPAASAAAPKPAKPGTVSFPCPGCGKTMNAPAAMAGKKGKCPHCQTVFVIGGGTAPQPSFGGLQPLGEADLQPLDSPQSAWSDPLASPGGLAPLGGGLAPLGGGGDLFASLPPAQPLAAKPLPAASNPLGYTPSPSPFGAGPGAPNPYASPNPYAANPYSAPMAYSRPTTAPAKLLIPAILLILISVITIGWMGISCVNLLLTPMPPPPPELDEAGRAGFQVGYWAVGVVVPLIAVLVNIGVIGGAIQMIRLRGYDTAKGGAIAAIVPCSACCVLNMPFGIWALIVLNQPDVRRLFQ